MKRKQCTKCKEVKPLDKFSKTKLNKDGRYSHCKKCRSESRKIAQEKRREAFNNGLITPPDYKICSKCKIKKQSHNFHLRLASTDCLSSMCSSCKHKADKKYYNENKESIIEMNKKWKEKNHKRYKEWYKQYYKENKVKINATNKERYYGNLELNREWHRQYYKDNAERIKKRINKRYHYIKNTKEYKERRKRYQKLYHEKLKNDPLLKLKAKIRQRTYEAFANMGYRKRSKNIKMLGAEWHIVKNHIERQFTKGMTWDNHGEWHIDHIIPLSSANSEKELMRLCHYRNLQPLWAKDNISKGAKIIEHVQTYLPL